MCAPHKRTEWICSSAIQLILARTPPGRIPGGYYSVNAVWRKEVIIDALPQAGHFQ
jgi:hypothetical protein